MISSINSEAQFQRDKELMDSYAYISKYEGEWRINVESIDIQTGEKSYYRGANNVTSLYGGKYYQFDIMMESNEIRYNYRYYLGYNYNNKKFFFIELNDYTGLYNIFEGNLEKGKLVLHLKNNENANNESRRVELEFISETKFSYTYYIKNKDKDNKTFYMLCIKKA